MKRMWRKEEKRNSPLRRARPERLRFPNPSVSTCDRVTGTTIHRHFVPFNPLRASPLPPASPRHLVPPDPLRRPNNPIRLFPARMYAYTEVCNFGVGYARYRMNERSVYRVSACRIFRTYGKRIVASFRKIAVPLEREFRLR